MRIVIPSVGYADMLATTLPAWRAELPYAQVVVATSPADTATREIAERSGAVVHATDAWQRDGAVFNKARAIDEAFGFDNLPEGTLCISIDADVVPFGKIEPSGGHWRPDTIYGAPRYFCPDTKTYRAYCQGRIRFQQLGLLARGSDAAPVFAYTQDDIAKAAIKCQGYFQAFLSQPGRRFKDHPTAGGYDGCFARSFARREVLPGFHVLHLGGRAKANWEGRVLPEWR